ncbi:MAG: hypothetical protein RBT11_06610 [Desulfobacterales bacterium]|jgi:hypothetical protein|nr:hypothetical protein [Desulfobacterales bacterium]
MEFTYINFWIIFQLVIDLALVVLILLLIRNMKTMLRKEAARETSREVIELMAPFIKETRAVAVAFEDQLKKKKKLVYQLNQDLDNRIISLNMLLNRAKACLDDPLGALVTPGQVCKQTEAILELHRQHLDVETIAKKLAMPKGEVELVIDLKTKFQPAE